MKPYFAVIVDSFREALASRVLWLVLVGVLLFLAALAPIGLRDEITTRFRRFDVASHERLLALLEAGAVTDQDSPPARIAGAMDESTQRRLRDAFTSESKRLRTHEAIEALNGLLDRDDWYDDDVWKSTTRLRELRELDATDDQSLSTQLRRRRARLRMEAGLPGAFHRRAGDSVRLRYAVFDFPDAFVLTQSQFEEVVSKLAIPLIVNLLVGVLGIFIAILVTGSIIPEMFQSGSLQLLLSKPVSRSMLFLAKFVGGCSFVVINITLVIIGLWLIAGLRLHIWNHNLLLCIPLFVFLFMVYYSVSAVAGLIWRGAIVSIAVTVVFWMACFMVRITNDLFEELVARPATITSVAELGDQLLATSHRGEVLQFDPSNNQWVPLLETGFGDGKRALGPVALPESGVVVAAQIRRGQFRAFSSSSDTLQLFTAAEDWKPVDGIDLPPGTRDIFHGPGDSLIAYGTRGILRAESSDLEPKPDKQGRDQEKNIFSGLIAMLGKPTEGFRQISPPTLSLNTPLSVCRIPGGGSIIVYTRGRLIRLDARGDETLEVASQVELAGEPDQRAAITATGQQIVLARETTGIEIYDRQSLGLLHTVTPLNHYQPTELAAQADGDAVAILYADGSLQIIDTTTGVSLDIDVPYQGSINDATWTDDHVLLLTHNLDSVLALDTRDGTIGSRWRPSRGGWRLIRDWVVKPLHTVFPRPGELGDAVEGIITGKEEVEARPKSEIDLAYDRRLLQIWQPITTCAVFTSLMLAAGCLYISRQDF